MELIFIIALLAAIVFWWQKKQVEAALTEREQRIARIAEHVRGLEATLDEIQELHGRSEDEKRQLQELVAKQDEINTALNVRIAALSVYQGVVDAEAEALRIVREASEQRRAIDQAAKVKKEKADAQLAAAGEEAARIIANAKKRAEEIAGEAFAMKGRADEFADAAAAMQNVIKGYGNEYIIPTYSLLDELAEEFGHTEAGESLKRSRDTTRALIKASRAATCDYAEDYRRQIATNFVIDAFNGKVDSILACGKSDNYGKLAQEIRDAYALVNHNGRAFRNAKITPEYLESRLTELKWAAVARALKDQEREEQRRIREQIREEEKARREYERAIRDASKEEETLRKAMEKARQEVARASEEERATFEAKLADLQVRLAEAEEKNQRALSMAQQTKTGHVYIISNIGSFGEEVFKIGMTRRLEPKDRIRELGDASVPFEFDVHAMIWSEDAPALERALHKHFLRMQMNKVNPRKEFFRLALADIRREVESLGITSHWTMTADAREYRETLKIEAQLREDPAAQAEWAKHQMEIDPVTFEEAEEIA